MKQVPKITLNFIKDIQNNESQIVDYEGLSILIEPSVFPVNSPFSYSSTITAKHIPQNSGVVLDVGTGTGIQGLVAAQRGAKKVLSIDIDDNAIANAKKNVKMNGFEEIIDVRKSNLFENIRADEKFDLVIAQLPFANSSADTPIDHLLFDPNFVLHKSFFSNIHNHLNKNGIVIIPSADFADDDALQELIKESKLSIKEVFEEEKYDAMWKTYILENTSTS